MRVMRPDELDWITRPHEQGEPARQDVPHGGAIRIDPGTPLQSVNHQTEDLLVYAYGTPPETAHAEVLDPAV
ncbi:MAG TPA: hypothetical protein VHW96_05605 [Solirubrobacteraceae bacterium]|jgi:hypothetical protein|nr:hypothetical protein [Solirubrobacteraceae bacterium]